MRIRKVVLMGLFALLLAAPARADWFISPLVGVNFGGDTNTDSRKPPFGVSLGYMGAQVIGFETTFMYTPSFFDDEDLIGSNNVMSWMGNVIVGVPIGTEQQVRPYVSGGVGLLRSRIGSDDATDLFDISRNDFGVNVGVGAMGFFTPNVGIRGDVRYFRSLSDDTGDFDIDLADFDFWQFTGGLAFRF